jgi:hypothetical protein
MCKLAFKNLIREYSLIQSQLNNITLDYQRNGIQCGIFIGISMGTDAGLKYDSVAVSVGPFRGMPF